MLESMPAVHGTRNGAFFMRRSLFLSVLLTVTILAVAPGAAAQPWQTYDTSNGEWRSYAGDIGGKKYSPLDQIDASNFADLEIAWEWTSVDTLISRTTPGGGEWSAPLDTIVESLVEENPELYRPGHPPLSSRLQATPLMVGGILYFNTPLGQGVAVDATTGETLWVFNPKGYEEGTPPMSNPWTQRGVAYWTDGADDERILWGTGAGYMVCVDAKTGWPCAEFGPDGSGMVDTTAGLPRANREDRDYLNAMLWGIFSAPIVVRDKVIHGSQVADRRITKEAVPGWVRAWDVRTGEHAWDFHTVPNSTDEVRRRNLAQRLVALLRERERLGDARGRQRARACVSADRNDHERLHRVRQAWGQPLFRDADCRRRRDRPAPVALPGCSPRALGLRLRDPSKSGGRHGRRA